MQDEGMKPLEFQKIFQEINDKGEEEDDEDGEEKI